MNYYHGHKDPIIIFENHINSRYGFPCVFFTDTEKLAYEYSNGHIVTKELFPTTTIDFKRKVSYSSEFRNLIFRLRNESDDMVLIKNVYDRPNENSIWQLVDILVVFNIELIK